MCRKNLLLMNDHNQMTEFILKIIINRTNLQQGKGKGA